MRCSADRWRIAVSATDLALLLVMAALAQAHRRAALAGSPISLLFAAQHAAVCLLTLLHRPAALATLRSVVRRSAAEPSVR